MISCVFDWYPANDKGLKFYNPQTKQMLQSRDVVFIEDKFDVKKSDCTEENFEFFTGLVGNTKNENAEYNNDTLCCLQG